MNLLRFLHEKLKIVSVNGRTFTGIINDYFYPDDNDNGKESIVMDTDTGLCIEFYEDDIQTAEIIK